MKINIHMVKAIAYYYYLQHVKWKAGTTQQIL